MCRSVQGLTNGRSVAKDSNQKTEGARPSLPRWEKNIKPNHEFLLVGIPVGIVIATVVSLYLLKYSCAAPRCRRMAARSQMRAWRLRKAPRLKTSASQLAARLIGGSGALVSVNKERPVLGLNVSYVTWSWTCRLGKRKRSRAEEAKKER